MYVVVGKDPNVPVFTIRPLTGKGKLVEKRVHRNNIISCNYLLEHGEEVRAGVERQEKQAVAACLRQSLRKRYLMQEESEPM